MPEWAYVDAIHGLMRLRARGGEGLGAGTLRRIPEWIDSGVERFEKRRPRTGRPHRHGLARAVRGFATVDPATVGGLHRELLGALALDPRDALVLGNLDRLYLAMREQPALSALTPRELDQRMAIVQAARVKAIEFK